MCCICTLGLRVFHPDCPPHQLGLNASANRLQHHIPASVQRLLVPPGQRLALVAGRAVEVGLDGRQSPGLLNDLVDVGAHGDLPGGVGLVLCNGWLVPTRGRRVGARLAVGDRRAAWPCPHPATPSSPSGAVAEHQPCLSASQHEHLHRAHDGAGD